MKKLLSTVILSLLIQSCATKTSELNSEMDENDKLLDKFQKENSKLMEKTGSNERIIEVDVPKPRLNIEESSAKDEEDLYPEGI